MQIQKQQSIADEVYNKLSNVKAQLGFLPNLFMSLSDSTITLNAYLDLSTSFSQAGFSDTENEVIQLATSLENQCGYCVAGHTAFAANKGVNSELIQNMRNGESISDHKLQALNHFTRSMVRQQGHVSQADYDEFLTAGYSNKQALEVILGISLKTFSNYTNNLVKIKLDPMFQPHQWSANTSKQNNSGEIK
jgi:uncharacterized peroxidase-related enzyme